MNDAERLDDWWNELVPSGIQDAVQQRAQTQQEANTQLWLAELAQWKARAEAAEARVKELEVLLGTVQFLASAPQEIAAAETRAVAAEAALAAVPCKAIYDCWYHSDGQTPDDSADTVEKWLEATRTATEPDWAKAPGLAKWWAVDEDGTAHWYWAEPTMGKHGWFVKGTNPYLVVTSQLAGHVELIGSDWWDTLRRKPGSSTS